MNKKSAQYKSLKEKEKQKALGRINELFLKAEKVFSKSTKLADRAVKQARKLAMKHKILMPRELKRRFCKHCYAFFKLSVNSRVRLVNRKVVYYCFSCKKYTRLPYVREQAEKRKKAAGKD